MTNEIMPIRVFINYDGKDRMQVLDMCGERRLFGTFKTIEDAEEFCQYHRLTIALYISDGKAVTRDELRAYQIKHVKVEDMHAGGFTTKPTLPAGITEQMIIDQYKCAGGDFPPTDDGCKKSCSCWNTGYCSHDRFIRVLIEHNYWDVITGVEHGRCNGMDTH
jgi:hypothetical protein